MEGDVNDHRRATQNMMTLFKEKTFLEEEFPSPHQLGQSTEQATRLNETTRNQIKPSCEHYMNETGATVEGRNVPHDSLLISLQRAP